MRGRETISDNLRTSCNSPDKLIHCITSMSADNVKDREAAAMAMFSDSLPIPSNICERGNMENYQTNNSLKEKYKTLEKKLRSEQSKW